MKNQMSSKRFYDSQTNDFFPTYQIIIVWIFLIGGFATWEIYHAYQFNMNITIIPSYNNFLKNLFWIIMFYGVILILSTRYIYVCHQKSVRNINIHKMYEENRLKLEQRLHKIQKLESLGILAGGIAHNFNNILMVIYGNCDLIIINPDPKLINNRVNEIKQAAKRASIICKSMLACTGKDSIKNEKIDLEKLINDTISSLKSKLDSNISINFIPKHTPLYINGNIILVREIITNLIINAIESIGENDGKITINLTKNNFSGKDYFGNKIKSNKYICMEIEDNGCGMDNETQKRLFDPFYTTKFTGRGLGISAALGIIKLHDGTLQLLSKQGVGTIFKIYFPIYEELEILVIKPTLEENTSKKILFAEDELSLRTLGKSTLEAIGFSAIEASNGREAVKLYSENRDEIFLVMLDLNMPEMNGREAYLEIRKISSTVPIVFCSGYNINEVSDLINIDKYLMFLQKPYSLSSLKEMLLRIK